VTILVAYGEIALKSRYVRNRLERILCNQISTILKKNGHKNFRVSRRYGRIFVENIDNEAAIIVSKVFGVVSSMPAQETSPDFESIIKTLLETAGHNLGNKETFAIRTRLVGKYPFKGRDLAIKGGSAILEKFNQRNISVNLDEPNHTFHIELRDQHGYIYTEIIQGVGGLPYATQGRMVSLFSGGIDSPVATWMIMKRGVEILPLFMNQQPYVGTDYVERAGKAFTQLRKYVPDEKFSLYSVNISDIMRKLLECDEPRFRCILCKRAMYRIAQQFAKKQNAKGIITGESLGQVASQTLNNLYVLDNAATIPVIRPVIALDKVEIEHISQRIGTYQITAKSVNGCTVVPNTPATISTIEKIEELEKKLELNRICKSIGESIRKVEV
jgi:thiamine biosynthesis protein ThiI